MIVGSNDAKMKRFILLLIAVGCTFSSSLGQTSGTSLPNPSLTPGAVAAVTSNDLCGSEYRSPDRSISITQKRQAFDRYGLSTRTGGYNIDHLIPVRLGGSNSPKNLWPQSLAGEWNYHMKNRLERRLHKLVCEKKISLETAQQEISRDWVSAYKKYMVKPASKGPA